MTLEVGRRWINGRWTTDIENEIPGGGGSLPAGGTTGEVLTKVSDADGDADWEASGGSTVTRGTFAADAPSVIANGATAYLSWDEVSDEGGPVVDLSDNTTPAVLAAGVYAVSVGVEAESLTTDGCYTVQLRIDVSGEGIVLVTDSRTATVAEPVVFVAISGTYYIPEGGGIRVRVQNRDGVDTRSFGIQIATVQRIS